MSAPLREYLDKHGLTFGDLAVRVGRHRTSFTEPLRGKKNASMNMAMDMERSTRGEITAEQFMAHCIAARRAMQRKPPKLKRRSVKK